MASNVDDDDSSRNSREDSSLLRKPGQTSLRMKESVYYFMVFQAPISRRKAGHYYTPEMLLAVCLLLLDLSLQLGLTVIAGSFFVARASAFQKELVNADMATTPWADLLDDTAEGLESNHEYVLQGVEAAIGYEMTEAEDSHRCCNGAECASLAIPCCNRRGAKPHPGMQPMRKEITPMDAVAGLPRSPSRKKVTVRSPEEEILGHRKKELLQMRKDLNATSEGSGDANTYARASSFLSLGKPAAKSKNSDKSDAQKKEGDEDGAKKRVTSICRQQGEAPNETLVCAPLSYSFSAFGKVLDENGDGMWTLEEARADEANLGCRLGLEVAEVFRSVARGIQRDNEDNSANQPYNAHVIPLSIQERTAVPMEYFEWWKGFALLCVVHDASRCGELVSRGIFDGAIGVDDQFAKAGVQDLDTALEYCQRLLSPGGLCERTLPPSYLMHRSRVADKCGVAFYSGGPQYQNPFDDKDVMQISQVSYSSVSSYETASTMRFQFFLGLILLLWYVNLVEEVFNVVELANFIDKMPRSKNSGLVTGGMRLRLEGFARSHYLSRRFTFSEEDEAENDDANHVIKEISQPHAVLCSIMLASKIFILGYMFHMGSNYLITCHRYDDLLLNSVALAFILELPQLLYVCLVSDKLKTELETVHTSDYDSMLPDRSSWWSLLFNKSFWGLVIIPILVIALVMFNNRVTTLPSLRALQCTCFQAGDHCEVAHKLKREWWNQYWKDMTVLFQKNFHPNTVPIS